MELGLYTFADVSRDPRTGESVSPEERLRNLIEEVELAYAVGLDVFGVGEHHRPDYSVSAPAVVLAAAAVRTKRIRLSSAVTVLSSGDPIRVFQQFATVDLLSGGRAEIMAGRGSFIESYPLFGQDLRDYDEIFAEKLGLLLEARDAERVTWKGSRHRAAIDGRGVYPRPAQDRLPIWIAVGGTPQSAVRAGTLGLPMALAIIGGVPDRFAPFVETYRDAGRRAGHDRAALPVGINSLGFVAETSQAAADGFFPYYAAAMNTVGRERGWLPIGRHDFDQMAGPHGALVIGSPQQVVDKVLREHEIFGHQRFLLQTSLGALPHREALRSIELFGTKVAPEIRKATAGGDGAMLASPWPAASTDSAGS
jgi:probable LLM family oxidoreductase